MPNHVTHKIIFASHEAARVSAVAPEGEFDFELLIPSPPHLYRGSLGREEEQDFPCNWHTWSRENWGTKWNAYDSSLNIVEDKAILKFDTAWSIPYPIISAFNNKFQIPFEHRYFDEGSNFWGIEIWGEPKSPFGGDGVSRIEKRFNKKEDYHALAVELKGYDPNDMSDSEDDDDGEGEV